MFAEPDTLLDNFQHAFDILKQGANKPG